MMHSGKVELMRQHVDDTSRGCANDIKGHTRCAQMPQQKLSHRNADNCTSMSDTAVVRQELFKSHTIMTTKQLEEEGLIAHRASHFLTALGLLITHRVAGAEHNSLNLRQEPLHATDRLLGLVHADRQTVWQIKAWSYRSCKGPTLSNTR